MLVVIIAGKHHCVGKKNRDLKFSKIMIINHTQSRKTMVNLGYSIHKLFLKKTTTFSWQLQVHWKAAAFLQGCSVKSVYTGQKVWSVHLKPGNPASVPKCLLPMCLQEYPGFTACIKSDIGTERRSNSEDDIPPITIVLWPKHIIFKIISS